MFNLKFKNRFKKLREVLTITSCACGLAIAANYAGLFQTLEWSAYDLWFRLRLSEEKETRIVVVTISESDIQALGQWPISDIVLSQLITEINQQQPNVIGLDIYRDLPVKPGTAELEAIFKATPNLVGVEQVIGETVKPSPILKQQEQIALADLVIDRDGKVRRGLLSIQLDNGEVQLGLATRLALMYLAEEGVELQAVQDSANRTLGKATFMPFASNDGGYIRADAGGFQILLNFRGTEESFAHVSILDVLSGNIPKDLFTDRLVLIGSTASSLNDLFVTPYSNDQDKYLPGVFIHANLASQIISAALDGRTSIRVVSEPYEWLWVWAWTLAGSGLSLVLLERNFLSKQTFSIIRSTTICLILPGIVLFAGGYALFLVGWWLPVITPMCSLIISIVTINNYCNEQQKRLALIDSLTQIPNRRFFEQFLADQWQQRQKKHQNISLILCDIDYFKKYNDTYGHQVGDDCLQQVAQTLAQSVRSFDLAARYGGEEFVVVLPNTNAEVALSIAHRIGTRLQSLKIPHSTSLASPYVSLSCGVASTNNSLIASPKDLVAHADRALYQAKEQGRDRAVLAD